MNPTATQRFRRATVALAVAWALFALFFSLHLKGQRRGEPHPPLLISEIAGGYWMVEWIDDSAAAAGVEVGDRLRRVDGELADHWLHRRPLPLTEGRPNTYEFEKRGRERVSVQLAPGSPGRPRGWIPLLVDLGLPLVGLLYLVIGCGVWLVRQERREAWALLLFCSTMAVALFGTGWLLGPVWSLAWFNLPLLAAAAFHLFSVYPLEPGWMVRHPRARLAPYALGAVLGVLAALESETTVWRSSASLFAAVVCFCGLGLLAVERRRATHTDLAERADVMLLGALVSFLPALLVLIGQYFLRTPLPWFLAFFGFALFPVAVAIGIVRKQLFDIRDLARSSAAYGAATLAITGLYAFLISFADAAVSRVQLDARSPWFSVTFLFFAVLAFNPLRNRLQGVVDRFFDRDRATYRRAVREISEVMGSVLSVKEIVDRILVAATDTMGLENALVLLVEGEEQMLRPVSSRGDWDPQALAYELPARHPVVKQLWMRRQILSRMSFEDESDTELRDACRDVFDSLEVELLVPILFGVDLLGVVAVGRKLSGGRLLPEDRQLLRTLANQSATAIENAKAYGEIARLNETLEARVEARTRELHDTQQQLMQSEKMKSLGQLVAGVAHELNNPIGFVHANMQLIDENIRRLVEAKESGGDVERPLAALRKLLDRSREGTERVKKIVQDLRTFSRMDQAELQDADLNQEIERTVALMEPRCKDCITIERDHGPLPPVRCYPGQLNQVFMNLLMNACDALEGSGTIRVNTRPIQGGVRLEFIDDGPGIAPDVQRRIFDPFFTTKPVGKGTGLGLSLSHGIVDRHGGRIWVESKPGEGTAFLIELPLDATPADA